MIREREKLLEQRETELKKDETKLLSEQPQELATLRSELQKLKDAAPPKPDSVHAIADGGTADMHLAIRGNLLRPGSVAPRRFLRIVAGADPIRFTSGSGRLELAEAVVSSQNPLTGASFCQSCLDASFRERTGSHTRQLRARSGKSRLIRNCSTG